MALFSWFLSRKKAGSSKKDESTLVQEPLTYYKSTMWPVAKVRENTFKQQQAYVNSISQLKKDSEVQELEKHVNQFQTK